jgi:cyclic beta-1,2-glucan synthetase
LLRASDSLSVWEFGASHTFLLEFIPGEGCEAPRLMIGRARTPQNMRAAPAGVNDPAAERGRALLRDHADLLYSVAAGSVVAATSAAVGMLAASGGAAPVSQALAAVVAIPLGAVYAGRVARPAVTRLLGASSIRLPKLATDGTVPRAWRTLVVIPAIVATPERVRQLLDQVARLAREHDDSNFRFAILADFADATSSTTSTDDEILSEEQCLVERINGALRDEAGDRVFVLQRERKWNAADRTWMGWERKRGKILELHRVLLGRSDTSYRWVFGGFKQQIVEGGFPYVFTLDEANWLPRGEILSVLCVAAHPANRAQLDPDTGRLIHGYAIFQPAVVSARPAAHPTHGATLVPLATGPHLAATRFHFDVLGVGIFQGKGLLDVRACHALLDDVFPPGVVLQHDPLEGFAARTAEINDAFVLEALAPSYLSQVQRGHRWLRGYFQMLPWLLHRVRGGDGAWRANPLRPIHRLFILEWVLTELARPASLLLLIAGWLALGGHAAIWTVLVCPPLAALLARLIANAFAPFADWFRRVFLAPASARKGWRSQRPSRVDALATVFSQAMLPYEALMVADALSRATWRMLVSRRHLLDWPPVGRVHAAIRREPREYRRVLWICYAVGLFTLAGVAAIHPGNLLIALPFAVAWICGPSLAAWLDSALAEPEIQDAVSPP